MNRASNAFRHVAVIAKPDDSDRLVDVLHRVRDLLETRGLTLMPDSQTARLLGLPAGRDVSDLACTCDLAIVVGGVLLIRSLGDKRREP